LYMEFYKQRQKEAGYHITNSWRISTTAGDIVTCGCGASPFLHVVVLSMTYTGMWRIVNHSFAHFCIYDSY